MSLELQQHLVMFSMTLNTWVASCPLQLPFCHSKDCNLTWLHLVHVQSDSVEKVRKIHCVGEESEKERCKNTLLVCIFRAGAHTKLWVAKAVCLSKMEQCCAVLIHALSRNSQLWLNLRWFSYWKQRMSVCTLVLLRLLQGCPVLAASKYPRSFPQDSHGELVNNAFSHCCVFPRIWNTVCFLFLFLM